MKIFSTKALDDLIVETEGELFTLTDKIIDKSNVQYNSERAALKEHILKLLKVIKKQDE